MDSPGTPLRYRKNGRLQACDPCRRRKVACDHARPICGSCRRRRRAEPCEYTMSTPAQLRSPRASASRTSTTPTRESRPLVSEPSPAGSGGQVEQPMTGSTAVECPQPADGGVREVRGRSRPDDGAALSGHLGFTSFGDIYKEVGNGLSDRDTREDRLPDSSGDREENDIAAQMPDLAPSATTMETCLAVLKSIPEEDKGRALFASHFDPHDGFVRPVGQRILDSLYETYGDCFKPDADEARLAALVRLICANTTRPFDEHEPDAQAWIAQFTGTNIRWETLGVLFTYWELSARNEHLVRPHTVAPRVGGRAAGARLRDVYRRCLEDCSALARRHTEVGNALLLFIYWKRIIVASIVSGDTSLSCWMYNGEAVSLTTFLGLHVDGPKGPYTPTLASEVRRRLLYKIFVIDKVVASITGRPPLLGRRYIATPPPLDLKDDFLVADERTLASEVAKLDDKGYNTNGEGYPITFWRARAQLMLIRDEIFEISLGYEADTSVESLYALKNKELEAAADMPAVLRFKESDVRDPDVDSEKLYPRMLMRLEHLQNLFFIERLLKRHGRANDRDLLAVSYEMTSATLLFWTNMDGLAMVYEDFKWLVMAYAAPGGGILCLELLKPSVTLTDVSISSSDGNLITRSSIVQLLSLLVGFLNWVSPKEANGNICTNCRAIVHRVLDQALNVAPGTAGAPAPDPMEWDFDAAHLDFNFDLLDTFEWMRPEFSWTDLPA
ncbi:fungal specific transcription factor [Colletotrichum plurivorum]|uniref:Fungal specific transcription factor n=1 Tax=Colletotrichum plurivorum TaxID=2175906 RepID=A0A8H6K487_9PEZI|nr:fungal specific transcription factor [Colletotrichum plurivorum]